MSIDVGKSIVYIPFFPFIRSARLDQFPPFVYMHAVKLTRSLYFPPCISVVTV